MSSTLSTTTYSSTGSTPTGGVASNKDNDDVLACHILNFQIVPAAYRRHELCSHQLEVPLVPHHAGDIRPGEAHGSAVGHHHEHGASTQGGADQALPQDIKARDGGLQRPASSQVRIANTWT